MAIYPLEFYRRAEEKWKRRAEALRTEAGKKGNGILVRGRGCSQSGKGSSPNTLPSNNLSLNVSWRS